MVSAQAEVCSYDECALRIETETGFFSGTRIVRGRGAVPVSGLSPSSALDSLFQRSDSASQWYNQFEVAHEKARFRNTVGNVLYLGGLVGYLLTGFDEDWALVGLGAAVASTGFRLSAVRPRKRASQALSRAIWWYNRELPDLRQNARPIRPVGRPAGLR